MYIIGPCMKTTRKSYWKTTDADKSKRIGRGVGREEGGREGNEWKERMMEEGERTVIEEEEGRQ